jgi:hypothetical protein
MVVTPIEEWGRMELDVEKFIAMVEWGQNINDYLDGVEMQNPARILETNDVETVTFKGPLKKIHQHFPLSRNVAMYLLWANDHAIAIYQSNGLYQLFDSNYKSGMAKVISDRRAIGAEVVNRLYALCHVPVPEQLEINICRIRDKEALQYMLAPRIDEEKEAMDLDEAVRPHV